MAHNCILLWELLLAKTASPTVMSPSQGLLTFNPWLMWYFKVPGPPYLNLGQL